LPGPSAFDVADGKPQESLALTEMSRNPFSNQEHSLLSMRPYFYQFAVIAVLAVATALDARAQAGTVQAPESL